MTRQSAVASSWPAWRPRYSSPPRIARKGHRHVRRLSDNISLTSDKIDHDHLYWVAESQAGYFTAEQALGAGMDRSTLSHHARAGGRYERIRRGLYRLRHFPPTPHEHVVAAWLGLANVPATVSHESALELYDLSDVIPNAVHVTVPREKRGQRPRHGVRFHSLEHPPGPNEIRRVAGVPRRAPSAPSSTRSKPAPSRSRSSSLSARRFNGV